VSPITLRDLSGSHDNTLFGVVFVDGGAKATLGCRFPVTEQGSVSSSQCDQDMDGYATKK